MLCPIDLGWISRVFFSPWLSEKVEASASTWTGPTILGPTLGLSWPEMRGKGGSYVCHSWAEKYLPALARLLRSQAARWRTLRQLIVEVVGWFSLDSRIPG